MSFKVPLLPTAFCSLIAVLGLVIASPARAQAGDTASQGKTVFEANCAICHKVDSTEKTIGPGLKGLYARGVMQDGTTKVTDETVTERIVNGKSPMPPFKDLIQPKEVKAIVEYLKTL